MPTVQKFDHAMIERFLQKKGYDYERDEIGNYQVTFPHNDETGGEWVVLYSSRPNSDLYVVTSFNDQKISKDQWGKAIMMCNDWNRDHLWPKVCLNINDKDRDTNGYISLDGSLNLRVGIHQELLDDFSLCITAYALEFWKWVHQEQGF